MASNDVYEDIECDISRNSTNSNSKSRNITLKAEEYLNSEDVKYCSDPKLKKERQRLEDLLESYKKLISKLDNRFKSDKEKVIEEKRLSKVPEIYAILHPEIYKNTRDEEKKKLIQKFSKRQFSAVDRIIPPTCRSPVITVSDTRQEEKERFIRVLSSSPSQFLNTYDSTVSPKKLQRPRTLALPLISPPNEREAEKERFSKILASSVIYHKKQPDQKQNPLSFRKQNRNKLGPNSEECSKGLPKKKSMVKTGNNSKLPSKEWRNNTNNNGFHEGTHLDIPDNRIELKNHISRGPKYNGKRLDKALSTTDLEAFEDEDVVALVSSNDSGRKSCSSISTQTDPSDISNVEDDEEPVQQFTSPSVFQEQQLYYLSPREKLMADLHGVSYCFPGGSPKFSPREDMQDAKLRQAAYAKALQEQIEEKRLIEDKRKQKEKEEEALIEQRMRLQQQKLESELDDEQKKKEDWIAQRQSHEEVLRRKMLEMELEAQEIKKFERRKRLDSDNQSKLRNGPTELRDSPVSIHSGSGLPKQIIAGPRLSETKFEALRSAPLLDADQQNIPVNYKNDYSLPTTSASRFVAGTNYKEAKSLEKLRADELLKAPLDFRIERPPSPPIPALQTRDIINNNTKLSPKDGKNFDRIGGERDNILTQLGAFRRQLHQEHVKLEARLQKQQTP